MGGCCARGSRLTVSLAGVALAFGAARRLLGVDSVRARLGRVIIKNYVRYNTVGHAPHHPGLTELRVTRARAGAEVEVDTQSRDPTRGANKKMRVR